MWSTLSPIPPWFQFSNGTRFVYGYAGNDSINGTFACLPFDINIRMPRHILSDMLSKISSCQIESQLLTYFMPPKTLLSIGSDVPHTWTACPPGLDLRELGLSPDEQIVSDGQFLAAFQYEKNTVYLPTRQTQRFMHQIYCEGCDDLHIVRTPKYKIDDLIMNA
ncbi:hypothetical protein EAF00_002995 [Botryotinia globosa]|nr:hypothetical protein EAF00_002995 [Botryotinia globosa]